MSGGASKIIPLPELAARVVDGSSLAVGGSLLHRGPFAFIRELIRQGRKNLELIKQSPGYDIDLLCRAGALARARAGIVAMEGNSGLAPWYRRAVETSQIRLEEHACATLTAGLRAAAFGVPFMPCGRRGKRVVSSKLLRSDHRRQRTMKIRNLSDLRAAVDGNGWAVTTNFSLPEAYRELSTKSLQKVRARRQRFGRRAPPGRPS